ncbi:hypothetical protein Plec18167_009124 [Paecilomyces lecythidis]|uniref:Exonuclease V n=1 Tax=Paecilomyces lecythidis TaxID=3004212 RepID=A0ABR3WRX2_9EURO
MTCRSPQLSSPGTGFDDGSSDYGSDFTPDEEELLNELLAKAAATHQRAATAQSSSQDQFHVSAITTATATVTAVEAEVPEQDLQSLQPNLVIGDIEDYEDPRTPRVPKVLGREKWSPRKTQQALWPWRPVSSQDKSNFGSARVEHPDSIEGRERERERARARELEWIQRENTPGSVEGSVELDVQSPLDRFRRPPNKAFSVTDLVSPAWCELQYWYVLTKHGRKRRTAAMKQGSAVHKVLEDEVHTTVPVEITTKEDAWALRIWNVIQGLRTLREYGMTRELEIWGLIDGEIVNGVIDQLSYECPDPELEASSEAYYADAQASRAVLPEYQMSLADYLLSPSQGGKKLSDLAWAEPQRASMDVSGPPPPEVFSIPRVYMTDIKTRGSRSVPTVSSSSFRPTQLQLQFYYHMLNRLIMSDDITMGLLASRYGLDPERAFSDAFIAKVGGLNDRFFDAPSSQESDPDYIPSRRQPSSSQTSAPSSSQDSTSILLSHNNLNTLWSLMKTQLRRAFIPSGDSTISPSIPALSQPDILAAYPTTLSPLLTAQYLSSTVTDDETSPKILGSRSFLYDPSSLDSYISEQMAWWRGGRAPRGVEVMDAWKCRICEFRDDCTWREEKERAFADRRRRRGSSAGVTI